jgi:hypothetical protein
MSQPSPIPVACSLDAAQMEDRVSQWRAFAARVSSRQPLDGGVRLQFDNAVDLGELARLCADEQQCCPFFAFSLTVDSRGRALEVRTPADGLAMIEELFGS